ncbi:hypothetical protein HPC49_28240 [Pyxidicoccus fallax]|uniref:Uncharacterized protein n=1 Tax=Pyxidicoccus fallax TaxID=394095 RepID=A0A848LSC7_9BACT|nr:hypothetical protein [Pyxidicoccus fallax]NMO20530.1 hypothetical protein [Pyxidicoccus fallax]NPC82095.1 hypothetical protein [Pyxidicoccus fallax]
MDVSRLPRGVAWLKVGLGLTELAFPRTARRMLGLSPRFGALSFACAGAKLATSLGLLTGADRRRWLWARSVGDVIDVAFLGSALQRRTRDFRWQLASTLAALGMAAIDLQALVKTYAAPAGTGTRRSLGTGGPADTLNAGPMESWRGSGLAEDVGTNAGAGGSAEQDPAREEKMREAERQLGLPSVDSPGAGV